MTLKVFIFGAVFFRHVFGKRRFHLTLLKGLPVETSEEWVFPKNLDSFLAPDTLIWIDLNAPVDEVKEILIVSALLSQTGGVDDLTFRFNLFFVIAETCCVVVRSRVISKLTSYNPDCKDV